MRGISTVTAALAAAVLASACQQRAAPYRFQSPLLASVRAAELPPRAAPPTPEVAAARQRQASIAAISAVTVPPAPPSAPSPTTTSTETTELGDHRVALLRDLVGERDRESTHVELARRALELLGAAADPDLAATRTGSDLMALAESRGAVLGDEPPRLGDLVVFDGVDAGQPASLVGVVITVDRRGTVEFLYLARGVVRRGFVNLGEPSRQRDDEGRILNTFVRHLDGAPPRGARFLAGELFAACIRLESLADQPAPQLPH